MDDIVVSGSSMTSTNSAILDSGTSLLVGPTEDVTAIAKAVVSGEGPTTTESPWCIEVLGWVVLVLHAYLSSAETCWLALWSNDALFSSVLFYSQRDRWHDAFELCACSKACLFEGNRFCTLDIIWVYLVGNLSCVP